MSLGNKILVGMAVTMALTSFLGIGGVVASFIAFLLIGWIK